MKEKAAAEAVLCSGFVLSPAVSPGRRMRDPAALHAVCKHHPEFQEVSLVPRWDDPILWRCLSPQAAEGGWEDLS